MDKLGLEKFFEAMYELRESKEMLFIINRITTTVHFQQGEVLNRLLTEIDFKGFQQFVQIISPLIGAIAAENEVELDSTVAATIFQLKVQFNIEVERDWLTEHIEPILTKPLRKAYVHRGASLGNVFVGMAGNVMSRHHRTLPKHFPFAQLRLDYVDNSSPQPVPQSVTLETTYDELKQFHDAIAEILESLKKAEGDM